VKKLIIILLFLCLPISVFAMDNLPNSVIDKIKIEIEIPEDLDTFQSSSNILNGKTLWSLSWSGENKPPVNVTADENGTIISFSSAWQNKINNVKRLPKISKIEATQTAVAFVVLVANDIIGQLDTATPTTVYDSGNPSGYNVRFVRRVDSINYDGDTVFVWVDAQTGKVTRYNRNFNMDAIFSSAKNVIDDKLAQQKFIENIGIELRYNKKIVSEMVIPYLVYTTPKSGAIDAVTGNAISTQKYIGTDGYFDIQEMYQKSVASSPGDSADVSGLMTGGEAQLYARDVPELKIDDDYIILQALYYKNNDGQYLITLKFAKSDEDFIEVILDAKTKELKAFLRSKVRVDTGTITEEVAKNIAIEYVKKYMQSYYASFSMPQIAKVNDSFVVLYERQVNAVPYKSNGVHFVIDSAGNINSISFAWDNVEFPKVEEALTKALAYESFFKNVGLELKFMKIDDVKIVPVYTTKASSTGIIDAKTGEILAYDGTPAKKRQRLAYVDLGTHYSQKQVTALADIDIFVSEGDVTLSDDIKQKDYIKLLSSISTIRMPIYEKFGTLTDVELDMLYNSFITNGVMSRDEIAPESPVTREQAVKYFIRAVGYKNVAELQGIFKMSFIDEADMSPNLYGYIALARGLKLIVGSEGYFWPKRFLTNGDSLIMVYNYMNRG